MKTYLITGAAGFIGANFIKYMLAKYPEIKIVVLDLLTYAGNLGTIAEDIDGERCEFVKGNICDRALTDELFAKYQFDYVVNFAAESHVDRSIENPQLFLVTNILGTQNLLDSARKAWVTGKAATGYPEWREGVRFHQVSTDEVYGSLGAEGYFHETTPLDPRSPYSASKTSADLFVQAYSETYKMPVSITRCSNNYGPYHFPEKLIPLIIKNILEGKSLPVYGDGTNVRDWLYVEDHARALYLVATRGEPGETYNIGGHNERKNIEVVETICQLLEELAPDKPQGVAHYRDLIAFVADRPGHDLRYAIDASKIARELGWTPAETFTSGMRKTVAWYLANEAWWRQVQDGSYQGERLGLQS